MTEPYYDQDGVVIYNSDCRDLLPSIEADVMITDPPYSQKTHDNVRNYGDGANTLGYGDAERIEFDGITHDFLRGVIDMARVKRWSIMTLDITLAAHLIIEPPSTVEFIRQGCWLKPRGAPQLTGDRPAMWWEPIMYFHPPGKKQWNGGGNPANFTCDTDRSVSHPTSKPLAMLHRLVEWFSEPDELILDPFMGSGSTLVAARNMGRRAVGIEISERFCEMAAKRLNQGILDFG